MSNRSDQRSGRVMSFSIDALLAELPQRLSEIPRRWAQESPEAPALWDRGVCWNYGQLNAAVDEGIALLHRLAVRPGDRVMIVAENCAAQVALIFAAAAIDAWSVSVNARLSQREIDAIREHCGARRVIFTLAVSPDAAAHGERLGAVRMSEPLLGALAAGPLNKECAPELVAASGAAQVAAVIYTTATTAHA